MAQLRRFTPEDLPWVLSAHAAHYAQVEGFDRSFAELVAKILEAFLHHRDAGCEMAWIAEDPTSQERLGCIFLTRHDPQTAKLRLFYLTPQARGQGVAQALFDELTQTARQLGYTELRLATHAEHLAACRFYAQNGLHLLSERPVTNYGRALTEQIWALDL